MTFIAEVAVDLRGTTGHEQKQAVTLAAITTRRDTVSHSRTLGVDDVRTMCTTKTEATRCGLR